MDGEKITEERKAEELKEATAFKFPKVPRRKLTPQEECETFCSNPSGKLQRLCRRLLIPGDHIWVQMGSIEHHGIYVGPTVIHFCSDGRKDKSLVEMNSMAIRETCWHVFTGQRRDVVVEVVDYEEAFDHDHSVYLAKQCVGKGDYSLFMNNCEHFSSHCRMGILTSAQVRRAAESGSGVIAVGTGATSGGVIAAAAGSYEVPVVLGSPTLGYWSQSVMANTVLGRVMAKGGLTATKLVVVPASASVVCYGVLAGAVVGVLGYTAYYFGSRVLGDSSKRACVSIIPKGSPHITEVVAEGTNSVIEVRVDGEAFKQFPIVGPITLPRNTEDVQALIAKEALKAPGVSSRLYIAAGYHDEGCNIFIPLEVPRPPRRTMECLPVAASFILITEEEAQPPEPDDLSQTQSDLFKTCANFSRDDTVS